MLYILLRTYRPLGYERVYLPLCKVADTPFYIQGDDTIYAQDILSMLRTYYLCSGHTIYAQDILSMLTRFVMRNHEDCQEFMEFTLDV